MFFLRITKGPCEGLSIPLREFPVLVGRDVQSVKKGGVNLADDKASEHHLLIHRKGSSFMLEDLQSTNGTFLNGRSVEKADVQLRDIIALGSTQMMLLKSSPRSRYTVSQHRPVISSRWGLFAPSRGVASGISAPGREDFVLESHHRSVSAQQVLEPPVNCERHSALISAFGSEIYGLNADLLAAHTLPEAGSMLLKLLGQKLQGLQRGMILVPRHHSLQLIPQTIHHFAQQRKACRLATTVLEEVVMRKRGVFCPAQQDGHEAEMVVHRLVLPIISREEVILLLHLEMDRGADVNARGETWDFIWTLLCGVAPTFDSLLLRESLDSWILNSVNTMMTALEAKDTYTAGHSERVCRYSMAIADELHMERDVKQLLLISSLCHDIGKIGTPDHILKNSSSLSHEEYEEIKHHPNIGDKIIHHLPNYHKIMGGVRHHHERLDGTGYPDGLKGDDIPLFGRIVAIADAFDAMVSGRSYSGFMEDYDAVEKLCQERDAFDPHLLEAFGRAFDCGAVSLRTGTIKRYIGEG